MQILEVLCGHTLEQFPKIEKLPVEMADSFWFCILI